MVTEKFSLSTTIEKNIPEAKKVFNEYDFAVQNQNKTTVLFNIQIKFYIRN